MEQIRKVVKVLFGQNESFEDNVFMYSFPANGGLQMGEAISEIFSKYFCNQCPGAIITTMITEEDETKCAFAAMIISANPEEHAARILAMRLAMAVDVGGED